MKHFIILIVMLFLFAGCSSESDYQINYKAPGIIEASQYQNTESGIKYFIFKSGSGAAPVYGQEVSIHYAGWLQDGTFFDSSIPKQKPLKFKLGRGIVIPGWEKAILQMKKGEIRQVVIPPELAYGASGFRDVIPPNAFLIFEMELVDFK